jgi:hypothetical protein
MHVYYIIMYYFIIVNLITFKENYNSQKSKEFPQPLWHQKINLGRKGLKLDTYSASLIQ